MGGCFCVDESEIGISQDHDLESECRDRSRHHDLESEEIRTTFIYQLSFLVQIPDIGQPGDMVVGDITGWDSTYTIHQINIKHRLHSSIICVVYCNQ